MTDLIVVGPGELGRLFAGGALRLGTRVSAVTREHGWDNVNASADAPVLVAVPEKALRTVVEQMPEGRRAHAILVQNELFPPGLQAWGLGQATVAVVWLAKKAGQPELVARASQAFGPHADAFVAWCAALGLPAVVLPDRTALAGALIDKYAFILSINALGLAEAITIGAWLEQDPDRVRAVIADAARLGSRLAGPTAPVGHDAQPAVLEAMRAMAAYPAKGRTAAVRLDKALALSADAGLDVPALAAVKNSLR